MPSKVTVTIRAFKAHRGHFGTHALREELLDGMAHIARQPGENLLSNVSFSPFSPFLKVKLQADWD